MVATPRARPVAAVEVIVAEVLVGDVLTEHIPQSDQWPQTPGQKAPSGTDPAARSLLE